MLPKEAGTHMRKVVIASLKGGCGKTTISTSLAAWWSQEGRETALLDLDPQGAATAWLRRRPPQRPLISGISPTSQARAVTLSFALRIPAGVERLIVDTPAGLAGTALADTVRGAAAVVVPVLPGEMDTAAAARTIADLLVVAKLGRHSGRLAVVANRVRRRTIAARRLQRFLTTLDIPLLTTLHDTQAYAHAIRHGLGLSELKSYRTAAECHAWQPLLEWLEARDLEISAETALGPRSLVPKPVPGTSRPAKA